MNDAVHPSAPVIELEAVVKRYGEKTAVKGLTLDVRAGELFAFLGPNGAGKTTTIKMIAGLLEPSAGRVRVCGHEMSSNGLAAKAQLAYVPDQPFLYEKLTGREFLHFVAEMYGMSVDRRDAVMDDLIARLDMNEFLDQLTGTYSHGMKQRVVLAAALLHEPRVLVIDEPMVGLDPRTVRSVKQHFIDMTRSGAAVFMSTHTLEVAEAVADRIGIIHLGDLVAVGTLAELREKASKDHSLEDIFLKHTEMGDGLLEH
jgi:ABC-2 type transport system ATP-binding protein